MKKKFKKVVKWEDVTWDEKTNLNIKHLFWITFPGINILMWFLCICKLISGNSRKVHWEEIK